jgi:hypothetical protein
MATIKHTNVNVYRWSLSDCTNGGVTARNNSMELFVDCTHDEAVAYCKEHNLDPNNQLILVRRDLWGENHDYAEPLMKPEHMAQTSGGNFIYSCDSRFREYTKSWQPIAVHDRFETWEQFDSMSR